MLLSWEWVCYRSEFCPVLLSPSLVLSYPSAFCHGMWYNAARRLSPDAGNLMLNFSAFRTVRNIYIFLVKYSICGNLFIAIQNKQVFQLQNKMFARFSKHKHLLGFREFEIHFLIYIKFKTQICCNRLGITPVIMMPQFPYTLRE